MADFNHELIIAAAREVGDMALSRWPGTAGAEELKVWAKADVSPVSEIDLAVDERLKAILSEIAPDAGWLSEETADDPVRLNRRRLWCVDPIDGTRDYVRGRKGWCVSIALVEDGAPIFGVLYAPARDELWTATKYQGAALNGEPIHASIRADFKGARVPAADLPKMDKDLTKVEQPNSIALRMAMVANDDADLVATLRWGYEWDIAAATLIAAEAGASVTDAFGNPLRFNTPRAQAFGVIASSPFIHEAVVARLADRAKAMVE